MRAFSRLGDALLAGALVLAPSTALAQEAPETTNTPAPETVGPRELQNFSLPGTVTRPADRPPTQSPPPAQQTRTEAPTATAPAQSTRAVPRPTREAPTALRQAPRTDTAAPAPAPGADAPEPLRQSALGSSVTVALPKLDSRLSGSSAATGSAPGTSFPPAPESPGTLSHGHDLPLLPWLLAALALAAGGAFLFWRSRSRGALAGGPQVSAFLAPEPAARPSAAPSPAPATKAPPPSLPGLVSTRLRPWVEVGFKPLRCILEKERMVVDFELELFNSGSAAARAVLAEASIFNAGPAQDGEIRAFFEKPVGQGERIVSIPPLQRVTVRAQVTTPREQILAYDLGGRQVVVPLIAFNVLYRWGNNEGQTSVAYLLGRDTSGEKLGPFRLDLGPRIFRGIAARLLPGGVRS